MDIQMFVGEETATVDVIAVLLPGEDENELPMTFGIDRCRMSQELLDGIRRYDAEAIDYLQALILAKGYRAIKTAQECMSPNMDCMELAKRYEILAIERSEGEVLAKIPYAGLRSTLRQIDLGL